jgi:hypothetical protein
MSQLGYWSTVLEKFEQYPFQGISIVEDWCHSMNLLPGVRTEYREAIRELLQAIQKVKKFL